MRSRSTTKSWAQSSKSAVSRPSCPTEIPSEANVLPGEPGPFWLHSLGVTPADAGALLGQAVEIHLSTWDTRT